MKTLLMVSVLLGGLLAASAAAVGAAETGPQEVLEDNQGEVKVVPEPEVEQPEMVPVEEEDSSPQGRFFCPYGWDRYKDGCFSLVTSSTSWHNAAANCASVGASLASAHGIFDYQFLQDLARRHGVTTAWIGLYYFQQWKWLDQSSYGYTNWNGPLSSTSYPCVYLNAQLNVGWRNAYCSNSRPYICKMKTSC